MPNNASSEKRRRQNEKRNLRNRAAKSEIKTWLKKLGDAIESKDRAVAETCARTAQTKLDKAVRRGIMHRNTVARRKSLLMRRLATLN